MSRVSRRAFVRRVAGAAAGVGAVSGTAFATDGNFAAHRPDEERLPRGVALYDYEPAGDAVGQYRAAGPINVLALGFDVETVERIFTGADASWDDPGAILDDGEGWDKLDDVGAEIQEHPRYCWDATRDAMVGPDREPDGGYVGLGESDLRTTGGYHARCWELADGVVSIQAHRDDPVYDFWDDSGIWHQVSSYREAEEHVASVLEDDRRANYSDTFDFDGMQAAPGDHDGTATVVRGHYGGDHDLPDR